MILHGSTIVYMGKTEEDDEKQPHSGYHAGRVETVVLAPGEQLLGCEMYHDGMYHGSATRGLTFLFWKAV